MSDNSKTDAERKEEYDKQVEDMRNRQPQPKTEPDATQKD